MAEKTAKKDLKKEVLDALKRSTAKIPSDDKEVVAAVQAYHKARDINMFQAGSGLDLYLPTSPERTFVAKSKFFGIPSRLGEGPCLVLVKFALPNGDIALKGDTFDPIVEGMSTMKYRSLKARKFFNVPDKKNEISIETKLLATEKKK